MSDKGVTWSVIPIYIMVTKIKEGFLVKMTNWLNWLHNINQSLDVGYDCISMLNRNKHQDLFTYNSESACFKALYPIMAHTPTKKFISIKPQMLLPVANIFLKSKKVNHSKDYGRNLLSRITNSVIKKSGIKKFSLVDILTDDQFVNLNDKDSLVIADTKLRDDILIDVDSDLLLNFILCISGLQPLTL